MTLREQVTKTIGSLTESQLHEVARYLSFLKFHSRYQSKASLDENKLEALYGEFSDNDRQLAEEDLKVYNKNLSAEDSK